ncbi:Conserved_hypothetical protein [Hexamita inflata]|uniref:Transmembrane protein n=1 Tax=Hexamita inflata TaxID=28002 RepID=A0AA86RKV8_9EUKA|nr:Conserved hypothetical protein [Hexamita inflata]
MFNLVLFTLEELSRNKKSILINCFEQAADINIFVDSMDIYITLQQVPSDCSIPHGVLVSIQLNSLGGYEPQIYLEDFDYGQTKLIIIKCDNPSCANLKVSSTGIIVMESKIEVTFIRTGTIQISRGKCINCFNDNDSYVELYQGSIVAVLFPTFKCVNTITTTQGQQLTMNTPIKAKVYITYTDNSITIHDQLTITVEQSIFIPEYQYTPQSIPIRIRLAHPEISQYFEQKITNNGSTTKDMKTFQVQLYFNTQNTNIPLIKVTKTYMNFYMLTGIQNVFDQLKIMFLSNGFVLQKQIGQYAQLANSYLVSLGVDSYQIEYIFVTYDSYLTDQLRVRLISKGLYNNLLFNNNSRLSNCHLRFPNQDCDVLMKQLKYWDVSKLTPYVTYHFYVGQQQVTNYTKILDAFVDSCFSTSYVEYDNATESARILVNPNNASKFCTLVRNDVLTVEISLGNSSQVLQSIDIDFIPGVQEYIVLGFDLHLHPEIRVQYYRSGEFQDAVSVTEYVAAIRENIIIQELLIVLYVLSFNLVFTVVYVLLVVQIIPGYTQRKKQHIKKVKQIVLDEDA